jgi:hypothetical protein
MTWTGAREGHLRGFPASLPGSPAPGTELRLPPGRAGALWPGGGAGERDCGRGGGREREERGTSAGRWSARWLPEEAAAGAEGARGPGTRSPRPPPPHAARPWTPGGGLG